MDQNQSVEGTIPLTVPSVDTPCYTFYKIFGDLRKGPPLVIVHGGPGSAHEYMLPYAKLWTQHGIPVVFYDQIGCASSTHIREKAGDKSFWSNDLFIKELENLLDFLHVRDADGPGFDLLGHSWGGMLVAAFAARQPRGLRRIILASALASVDLWRECLPYFKSKLTPEARQALEDVLKSGNLENPSQAFREAEATYMKTFWCRKDPIPPELLTIKKHGEIDSTVRKTMYGPSVYMCNGTLQDWTCIPLLTQINVPTLVYNGEFDVAQDRVTAPFFELIPRVRWVTLPGASHMMHVESEELLQKIFGFVVSFLRGGSEDVKG
ncbi:related to proline iminopeptidase [Ramularia collo-cygni]|uniref:Related to proline iminopeptidase n=1 Tax=Ramularia collo-cygni TaxID=112498 RepID=A0A2D3VJ00_9PEZI|nr:related to proline iminopeptidase [Ramularia collo-cygni]CZT20853.1 related to proline iminopeptidase [Ramularia collo-cygni]